MLYGWFLDDSHPSSDLPINDTDDQWTVMDPNHWLQIGITICSTVETCVETQCCKVCTIPSGHYTSGMTYQRFWEKSTKHIEYFDVAPMDGVSIRDIPCRDSVIHIGTLGNTPAMDFPHSQTFSHASRCNTLSIIHRLRFSSWSLSQTVYYILFLPYKFI